MHDQSGVDPQECRTAYRARLLQAAAKANRDILRRELLVGSHWTAAAAAGWQGEERCSGMKSRRALVVRPWLPKTAACRLEVNEVVSRTRRVGQLHRHQRTESGRPSFYAFHCLNRWLAQFAA